MGHAFSPPYLLIPVPPALTEEDYLLLIRVEGLWRIRGMELFCIWLQTWDHVLDLGFSLLKAGA